jgi:hypothetical protein
MLPDALPSRTGTATNSLAAAFVLDMFASCGYDS